MSNNPFDFTKNDLQFFYEDTELIFSEEINNAFSQDTSTNQAEEIAQTASPVKETDIEIKENIPSQKEEIKAVSNPINIPKITPVPLVPLKFIGNSNPEILFITPQNPASYGLEEREMFKNIIIKGLKIPGNEMGVLVLTDLQKEHFTQVISQLKTKLIIFWGKPPSFIPLRDLYQIFEFEGKNVMVSDKAEEVSLSKELKSNLWLALKKHFNL